MSLLRALILDFDGVILESNDLKTRAFEVVFGRFPTFFDQMMAFHHAHMPESRFVKFRHLATAHLGLREDDPIVDQLGADFSAEMLRQVHDCPMVPGARELLERATRVVPVFLASVTPQDEIETILAARGFGPYFTRVYGCPPWTKVRAIADIVDRFGGPRDILFVGDSSGDQRAAAATGVEFIARDSGLPFDDPQPRQCADLVEVLHAISPRLPTH